MRIMRVSKRVCVGKPLAALSTVLRGRHTSNDAPVGNIKAEIVIHTTDPDQPQIKVPVYAFVED